MDINGTINKVILIGRLGDDVKMHYFENGGCVGRFPLATDEGYTNRNNGRMVATEWHNIVMRNKTAEVAEKYLSKGDRIYLEGKLKTRQWQAEDNSTRYVTEIYVTEFSFLDTKKKSDTTNSPAKPTETPKAENPTTEIPTTEFPKKEGNDLEDVPF